MCAKRIRQRKLQSCKNPRATEKAKPVFEMTAEKRLQVDQETWVPSTRQPDIHGSALHKQMAAGIKTGEHLLNRRQNAIYWTFCVLFRYQTTTWPHSAIQNISFHLNGGSSSLFRLKNIRVLNCLVYLCVCIWFEKNWKFWRSDTVHSIFFCSNLSFHLTE